MLVEIPFSIDAFNIRGIWKLFCSFSYLILDMNVILDVFFEKFFKNNIVTTSRYAVIRQFEALSDKEEGLSTLWGDYIPALGMTDHIPLHRSF